MDAFVALATAYTKELMINPSTTTVAGGELSPKNNNSSNNNISKDDTFERPSSGKRSANRPNITESNKSFNASDITSGLELGR